MAGWVKGVGIGKQLYSCKSAVQVALLIFIATCASVPRFYAQESLFVSIDCGGQTTYNDSHSLQWVPDDSYIKTGNSYKQNYTGTDSPALGSFRDFPGDQSKYCYEVKTPRFTYLIRASFYMDHSEFTARQPFEFLVSVDATDWFTVTSGDVTSLSHLLVVQEGIFILQQFVTSVCLRPVSGTPFISSLEVRPLDPNSTYPTQMYNYQGRLTQYLALGVRYNAGATNTTPDVRYPEDPYDRIWKTPDAYVQGNFTIMRSMQPTPNTTVDQFFVPQKVMQDALTCPPSSDIYNVLTLPAYAHGPQAYVTPTDYALVVIYYEHLATSAAGSSEITVGVNNVIFHGLNFSTEPNMLSQAFNILWGNNLGIWVQSPSISPSINAVEVYGQLSFNTSATNQSDVVAISLLKTLFSLTDWQGDPCVPVPHNWLSCGVDNSTHTLWNAGSDINVTSLNISNSKANFSSISGDLEVSPTQLGLNSMSITSSGVDYPTFLFLISLASSDLLTLNLSYNAIDQLPLTTDWTGTGNHSFGKGFGSLKTLDLSHNNLTGLLSSFEGAPFCRTLQNLILSYNNLVSFPNTWGNQGGNKTINNLGILDLSHNWFSGNISSLDKLVEINSGSLQQLDLSYNYLTGIFASHWYSSLRFVNLSYNSFTSLRQSRWRNTTINNLETLDLSHNQFSGDISSLDEWVQINSGSLQTLDASHNSLSGMFSSNLYFSLPNLTFANFDHNSIDGILHLSPWYEVALQEAYRLASVRQKLTPKLFSFINNSITAIVPSAEDFDPILEDLFKADPAFGIMLNGNPYCNDIKSSVQQYLCRPAVNDPFQVARFSEAPTQASTNYWKEILIISLCGGIVALLFFSIASATLWKLWKQLYTLRTIQQALADRNVQPPFYHYNDLKTATREFHKDNKLGHGGFGVVYKGVLRDETLAVKKLFNSTKVQIIDEFLNEVILITGIKHRNLVKLKGCCIKEKQRILVYEYAERGNLAEALWGSNVYGKLNWKQRHNICVGVARGLSYLHEELQPSIIHRDIKPQNILLDNNLNPKIADFGLARHVSDETEEAHYTQIAGTLGYFAPEYATEGQVSDKTDVYSYGILVLEIISGRKCIDSTRPIDERYLKQWAFSMRKESLSFDILEPELREDCNVAEAIRAVDIGLLCAQYNPRKRPSMSQVVTMLLGNMDVEFFSDEFDNIHSNLTDHMSTTVTNDLSHEAEHLAHTA